MMREEIVFGPIRSRRLGESLGINLLPEKGKLCNFDCIYCECGWNKDGRDDKSIPDASRLRAALEAKLLDCASRGVKIDSVTFSGDGEPTLNPDFPEIVDITVALRDKYYPAAAVSVLTNATRISEEAVFSALRKVDAAILKLDAPTNALAAVINRPHGRYDVAEIVNGMERFGGDFVLQTMFLRAPGFDSLSPEVIGGWTDIVRRLRPREIMAYTVDRPAPLAGISKISPEQIREALRPLTEEGFNIKIYG